MVIDVEARRGPSRGPSCSSASFILAVSASSAISPVSGIDGRRRGLVRDGVIALAAGRSPPPAFRLLEVIAVAVHLEDFDRVRETTEQRAGQPFRAEHARPILERQVRVRGGAKVGQRSDGVVLSRGGVKVGH